MPQLTHHISNEKRSQGLHLFSRIILNTAVAALGSSVLLYIISLSLCPWRSKVLCRWLAALPVQLMHLGHRNPALSARLILAIQAAASRGNKDLLYSLETEACSLYGMNTADRWTKKLITEVSATTPVIKQSLLTVNIRYNYHIFSTALFEHLICWQLKQDRKLAANGVCVWKLFITRAMPQSQVLAGTVNTWSADLSTITCLFCACLQSIYSRTVEMQRFFCIECLFPFLWLIKYNYCSVPASNLGTFNSMKNQKKQVSYCS